MTTDDIIESKIIDRWTPVHISAGFALRRIVTKKLPVAVAILSGFEVIENLPVTRKFLKRLNFRGRETPDNIASDIGFGILGFVLAGFGDDK